MDETGLGASPGEERERKGASARTRRLRVALGCLFALTTFCVGVCGVAGYGFKRHASDVRRYEPAPMPVAAAEADPSFRLLAEARARVGTEAITSCSDLEVAIADELADLSDQEAFVFHEWTRARIAELDTQPMREACQIVGYGACSEEVFLWFRAYLLAMGRPTFALAVADDDQALARILPKTPYCQSLVDFTYAAAVRTVLIEDAGIDASRRDPDAGDGGADDGSVDASILEAPSDAGIEADAGLPLASRIEATTSTRLRARRELGSSHPSLCHRFTCTFEDVFD